MFGTKRRQRELSAEEAAETAEAVEATETDDSSIDPDERVEAEEEPGDTGPSVG